MFAFLQAPENIAFVSAMVLVLIIGVVQALGLGGDFGMDADVDADLDVDMDGGGIDLLGWLGVGRLPLLMLLVVFLGIFGIGGLVLQQVVLGATGAMLSGWIAAPAMAVASAPLTGAIARGLARVLPKDFTTAVPLEVLIGRSGRIVTGRAVPGSPARARVEDQYGQAHYLMVEPDTSGAAFEEGEAIQIVRREGDVFRAISRGEQYLPRL